MNKLLSIILSIVLIACFSGCDKSKETKLCAKCGNKATTSIGGTAYTMQKLGIDLNNCTKITSEVYSADMCEDCIDGPIVDPFKKPLVPTG